LENSAQIDGVTACFGAPYIACEASFAVAAHAVLDAWARANQALQAHGEASYDAVLIACFGDPGLLALRQICPVPVTGLAEASFLEASRRGRFGIVTGGAAWAPMLARLGHSLGYRAALAEIHTVAATGAELARDPVAAQAVLSNACKTVVADSGVASVILGGAGLVGLARAVQRLVPVPVIDSVAAGVRHAMALCGRPVAVPVPLAFNWQGVSPALAATGVCVDA
jgi:Asp/Glu/hydantoin racemase